MTSELELKDLANVLDAVARKCLRLPSAIVA
jgi:hypothetical protein